MKTWVCATLTVMATTIGAEAANLFTIGVNAEGAAQVLTVQGRAVTSEKLREVATKLAVLDPEQVVVVKVHAKASAERLFSVLRLVEDCGLKNVCVTPFGGRGLDVLRVRILPKANEFFRVDLEAAVELEDEDTPESPKPEM